VNVHAYVLGEHGESCVPVWSHSSIGCTPLKNMPEYDQGRLDEIFEEVRNVSKKIIKYKGATYYAVSLGVTKIIQAIDLDQNRVLPVSTYLNGYHEAYDVCLSAPCVVNKDGVSKVLDIPLDEAEKERFRQSAEKIGNTLDELGIRD